MRISQHLLPAMASVTLCAPLALAAFVFTSDANAQEPESEAPVPTYSGLWETSYGRMRLTQEGSTVSGEYSYTSTSTIAGEIEGDRLTFGYSEGDTQGEGWYELAKDGESFQGRWREKGSEHWKRWRGTRVHPEKKIIWLVILEAHWETSLAEKEYAFGDMLHSYFTMESARHVRVRYRTFHSEKDLRRWSREARYLAEPVVLLISTHGTPRGVQVAGEVIGAEALADCVRGCQNLKVLHLSGCSMMAGDIPAAIQKSIGPEQKLPITGYTTDVAWDASALADFVYLSMLLIHRLDPTEAVEQTHLLAPFTREDRLPGARFQALGLRLLDAEGKSSATKPSDAKGVVRRARPGQERPGRDRQRPEDDTER